MTISRTLTRAQVREVDRRAIAEYDMSGLVLMENAGRGATDVLCRLLAEIGKPAGPVVVVCGRGNNGGDGFVIARHLDLRGVEVKVLLCADPAKLSGDAAANFLILQKAGPPIIAFTSGVARPESAKGVVEPFETAHFVAELAGAVYLVDALLGTGATGEPRPPVSDAIEAMNASGVPILAVDVPSGMDCDTGAAARHTIRAGHTCTFVAAKPGLVGSSSADWVGELHVQDIGVPRRLMEEISRSC